MTLSEKALGWVADRLDSSDFIDIYFILSDLVDINLTDIEMCETASFDSLASETVREVGERQKHIPIGKQVF